MPKLIFVDDSGLEHMVEAESGASVMQAATQAGIPEIEAICGGACACGTCHVLVDESWVERVAGPDESEVALLEVLDEGHKRSRLCCQIKVEEHLDGLILHLPRR